MEDKSMLNETNGLDISQIETDYVSECLMEICINGDMLSKYKIPLEKKYGPEFYKDCNDFVAEVQHSVSNKVFSSTSVAHLNYLAKKIHVTSNVVETIKEHFERQFETDKKKKIGAVIVLVILIIFALITTRFGLLIIIVLGLAIDYKAKLFFFKKKD